MVTFRKNLIFPYSAIPRFTNSQFYGYLSKLLNVFITYERIMNKHTAAVYLP